MIVWLKGLGVTLCCVIELYCCAISRNQCHCATQLLWKPDCPVCVFVYGGCVIVGCQLHSRVLTTISDPSLIVVIMCAFYEGVLMFSTAELLSVTLELRNLRLAHYLPIPFWVCVCLLQVNVWRVCQRTMWCSYTPAVSGPQWRPTA